MVERELDRQKLVKQIADFIFLSFKYSRGQAFLQEKFYEYYFLQNPNIADSLMRIDSRRLADEIFLQIHNRVKSFVQGKQTNGESGGSAHIDLDDNKIEIELKNQIKKLLAQMVQPRIEVKARKAEILKEMINSMIERDLQYLNNKLPEKPNSRRSDVVIYAMQGESTSNDFFNELFGEIGVYIKHQPEKFKREFLELEALHNQIQIANRNRKQE